MLSFDFAFFYHSSRYKPDRRINESVTCKFFARTVRAYRLGHVRNSPVHAPIHDAVIVIVLLRVRADLWSRRLAIVIK